MTDTAPSRQMSRCSPECHQVQGRTRRGLCTWGCSPCSTEWDHTLQPWLVLYAEALLAVLMMTACFESDQCAHAECQWAASSTIQAAMVHLLYSVGDAGQ